MKHKKVNCTIFIYFLSWNSMTETYRVWLILFILCLLVDTYFTRWCRAVLREVSREANHRQWRYLRSNIYIVYLLPISTYLHSTCIVPRSLTVLTVDHVFASWCELYSGRNLFNQSVVSSVLMCVVVVTHLL